MEKREFPRNELIIPLTLTCNNAEFIGETQNVSINGLLVRVDKEIDEHSSVKVALRPEEDFCNVIECHGRVIRKTDKGVGVRIESMELQSYIKWRYLVTRVKGPMCEIEPETPTFVVQ